ncbi:HAD family hydrolase [Ferdinandcohnia quinoae]|uniref:HAD family hydrolase n=1 Tax=Fredinandcohnia quinoae TaxID=2918902 RepID=A0AAW5ECL1_9BACI|nr:HAD family hydrolase [Fredinandcohnia sp. SECRCQ15]MCH1627637.1 HAD family hydrolase [Fredinandcohnia sp. SECRCQ15]
MINAVIFDFDGLIFDTESHEYNVLNEIFQEHGSELPLPVWGKVIGTQAGFKPLLYLEEQLGEKLDQDMLEKLLNERFQERLKNEGPLPGVVEYLKAAKESGLKIGLASSSTYEWVSSHLKNLCLFDYFECIRTSDDVEEVKPNPSLYLKAASCLGVEPEECLVFEDSANGALAAKRAGMYCVIVPNEVTKDLNFCEVDDRIDSMAVIELKQLIAKIENRT